MINLLPPELKETYVYAHRNTKLIKWVASFSAALIGLVLISALGNLYVNQSSHNYDKQISELQSSLQANKLGETVKQTKEVSNNLKLAIQVLSKEVLFSKLLKQLALLTPSNANLTVLDINPNQSGIDISAQTTDYNVATQYQINLQDPNNKLFSKADIVSITCSTSNTSEVDTKYPCTVVIRALFAKNNPYLFINNGKTK